MFHALTPLLTLLSLLFAMPLLGAFLSGQPLAELMHLPLTQRAWDPLPAGPLWSALLTTASLCTLAAALWFARPRGTPARASAPATPGPLPRFTWFALLSLGLTVIAVEGGAILLGGGLATLSVALLANADTQRRTGTCLISRRPGYFLSLFPASLALGWAFYWIDLFVQLWHYPAATESVPFVLGKSVGDALLLPALLSIRQWLASFPRVLGWTTRARPLGGSGSREEGWILLALACAGLLGTAVWPDRIYPLTMLAPLLCALGMQQVGGRPTLFSGLGNGDWSRVLLPALAALIIGLLLQGWNTAIGPGWVVTLPLVDGPLWLGVPLIGFLWMLPTGLLGVWVADQLAAPWRDRPQAPQQRPRFPVKIVIGNR